MFGAHTALGWSFCIWLHFHGKLVLWVLVSFPGCSIIVYHIAVFTLAQWIVLIALFFMQARQFSTSPVNAKLVTVSVSVNLCIGVCCYDLVLMLVPEVCLLKGPWTHVHLVATSLFYTNIIVRPALIVMFVNVWCRFQTYLIRIFTICCWSYKFIHVCKDCFSHVTICSVDGDDENMIAFWLFSWLTS